MKLTYRPEIDGLRAIAVGAVILYHSQITLFGHQIFKGGFIGVDIFFVISGYLITSIILNELVTTGTFSFKNFYERRIRRILPALFFVMMVSLPFAWMYLLPSNFIDFSKSILYSIGLSSNFYFHYSGQQYGATDGLLKPFLHTWSLSVEEQYYILFPIVLFIIFKFSRKYLVHTLILGFFISLVLADWTSRNYPSISFYFLHTRMWELLAGSILAYFEIKQGHRSKNKKFNLILPTTGVFLIIHYILFFNYKMLHPSFYTLSPIIGVCLIIWFSDKDEIINKLLSTKLFVGIGLISYSLYLWHYPIFALARVNEFTDGNYLKKFFLILVLLVISVISYYFVERLFRKKKNNTKKVFNLIIIFICSLLISNSSIILKEGYKDRLPELFSVDLTTYPPYFLKNSKNEICFTNEYGCYFDKSKIKKIYAIGDSHLASISFDLQKKISDRNYQFILYSLSNCLYFPGFDKIQIKTSKLDKKCNDNYFKNLKTILSTEKNSIIIFFGRYPLYFTQKYFDNKEGGIEGAEWGEKYISLGDYSNIQDSFKNEVFELSKNNKILIIYPIPELGWNVANKLRIFFKNQPKNVNKKILTKNDFITTSHKVYKERTQSSFELLDSIKSNNIYRVYPHTLFCDIIIKNRCVANDEKNIFYFDDDHPSLKGAEMINDLIMKEIEKIELKLN